MTSVRRACAAAAVLGCIVAPASAFAQAAAPARPPQGTEAPKEKTLSDRFEGLEFRNIGPYRGGRSCAVAGVRHQPNTFYFGGAGGGVGMLRVRPANEFGRTVLVPVWLVR